MLGDFFAWLFLLWLEEQTYIGDHQPYTATTKDLKKEFPRGWCTNCQNLREQQNIYHPQDCTGQFIMAFVGVVRGLWGSIKHTSGVNKSARERIGRQNNEFVPEKVPSKI